MATSLQDYLEFAAGLAYSAGRLTLGYYQNGVRVDLKADASPVTTDSWTRFASR